MIGFLSGKIHGVSETTATIDVNGVGYAVHLAKSILLTLGQTGTAVQLEIHTHVTENSFQLFGFQNLRQKAIFLKLISVSGIGPKLALNIISDLPVTDLLSAVVQGNVAALTQINGVGKKTAERMVVELKDKFKDDVTLSKVANVANDNKNEDLRINDVTSALMSLGYAESQARRIVSGLTINENDTVQTLIKKSLAPNQR